MIGQAMLPPMERSESLILSPGEVLITAGGFEDRALAAAERVVASKQSRAIVLRYWPHDARNRLDELVAVLARAGLSEDRTRIVDYDRLSPHDFPSELERHLQDLGAQDVVLDVSGLSKLGILLSLDVCRERNIRLRVFYAEAASYGPTREAYERARRGAKIYRPSIQVYTGVSGVLRIDRLSSVAMQGQPTAALAFMSFNELLTQALLDAVYPSRFFLINGRPPRLGWREEATAWIHEQLRREWGSDNPLAQASPSGVELPQRSVSTLEYQETVGVLLNLYWKYAVNHRMLLAPTGSKMQTLGCYVVKAMHPDIHIEYPTPEGFLDLYSTGVYDTWTIDFGRVGDTVREWATAERAARLAIAAA